MTLQFLMVVRKIVYQTKIYHNPDLDKMNIDVLNDHALQFFEIRINKFCQKIFRSRQGSNLRGETPLDFKSNALTTRPRLLTTSLGEA